MRQLKGVLAVITILSGCGGGGVEQPPPPPPPDDKILCACTCEARCRPEEVLQDSQLPIVGKGKFDFR